MTDKITKTPVAPSAPNRLSRPYSVYGHVAPQPGESAMKAATSSPKAAARRLHRKRAADYLGVSLSWLDKSRLTGMGPVFITIGGRVLYDTADLEDFMQKNRHTSTSG